MPTPTTPLETTMANDPDSLTRPQMPNPDDDLRARQQRDLYCVLTNSHDDIAELWFQEHVHDEVIAVWGAPDIGSANSLADGSSQLSVLYVEEPTVLHRDPSGMALVETYMPDYWVGQQWTQYCTLGIGEWLRHVKWDDATEQLVFRHVRPDNCYVVTTSAEPTKPIALAELRLYQDSEGNWYYAWDVHDCQKPDDPVFRIIKGDIDEFCRPLEGAEIVQEKRGAEYPARNADGKGVVPYGTYRWQDIGEMWSFQLQRGAYHSTLTASLYWTGVRRAAVHSSGPHCKTVGLKPPGGMNKAGTQDASISRPILPGSTEYCVMDPEYKGGTPQLWEISPGDHLGDIVSLATEYGVRSLMRFGIDGSDVSRQSAAPESGLALFLHSKVKRQFQRRVAPLFRRSDQHVLYIASAVLRVQGVEVPEDGYSITYYEIPESPQEEKERRERLAWKREHGLLNDVDLYIDEHPGADREAAMASIIRNKLEQRRLEQRLREVLEAEGLADDPPPQKPEPTQPNTTTEE